jgi:ribonuclease P protein component
MLPKEHRLRLFKDFKNVLEKGFGLRENGFYVKFVDNNLLKTRVAVVVSKKQYKKATQRNKIKRKVKEVIRKNLSQIKEGKDIIIVIFKGLEKEKINDLQSKIMSIFDKLKLTKK